MLREPPARRLTKQTSGPNRANPKKNNREHLKAMDTTTTTTATPQESSSPSLSKGFVAVHVGAGTPFPFHVPQPHKQKK